MKKLLLPLFASVLVGLGAPAQAQETIVPMGRICQTQLAIIGGVGGGIPGLWLSPWVWHATDGDVFTWVAAGALLSTPMWGITYGIIGVPLTLAGVIKKEEKK